MIRFLVFCIFISPAWFLFGDFKDFLEHINPMSNWETLTHFVGVYLFPALFVGLFIFYPQKTKILAKSLFLGILCLVTLFLLNMTNEAILFFKDDTVCFTLFAYSVSLFFFFYACFYSLLISRNEYANLVLTFIIYHWWFIYLTEHQFEFEINGFVASGTLVLVNLILLLLLLLFMRLTRITSTTD
jgi:hypothetical protein